LKWTKQEEQIIIDNWKLMSDEELCVLLFPRTLSSVSCKRKDMKLKRPSGNKKYSFDDVVHYIEKKNYILKSDATDFHNAGSKIKYICKIHEEIGEQHTTLGHLLEGKGCPHCGRIANGNKKRIALDKEKHKVLAESKDFTYIDTIRMDGIIFIKFICNKHKDFGIQLMQQKNMERDIKGCKYCFGRQLPKQYVMQKAAEVNPNVQLLEPYTKLSARIKCRCIKHNVISTKSMQDILNGRGCYLCGLEKLSAHNYLTLDEFSLKVTRLVPNISVLEYHGMKNNVKLQCKLCGFIYLSHASHMVKKGKSCPKCSRFYWGEKQISNLLDKWGYQFETQKKYQDCKDKRPLPFDFYLPEYNTLIEFDGEQHFRPVWGLNSFSKTVSHDNIKDDYCRKNKIYLIRITCYDDIEYKLFDELVKLNIIKEIPSIA